MTAEQLKQEVIRAAYMEVGYIGDNGASAMVPYKTNKFAYALDQAGIYNGKKNGYDWCAIFVDYVMLKACNFNVSAFIDLTNHTTLGAGVKYAMRQYTYRSYEQPEVGDEVFYYNESSARWTHTGIVVEVFNTGFTTIEGNCSNSVKRYANSFKKVGYKFIFGRPDYEKAAKFMNKLNDFEQWAVDSGLFAGRSDGEFHFDDPITRGEIAIVLKRFHDKYILDLDSKIKASIAEIKERM